MIRKLASLPVTFRGFQTFSLSQVGLSDLEVRGGNHVTTQWSGTQKRSEAICPRNSYTPLKAAFVPDDISKGGLESLRPGLSDVGGN